MKRPDTPGDFLLPEEQQQILAAIRTAEAACSAEIRLCIEKSLPLLNGDPYKRARTLFAQLGMHKTQAHNGVLFYLATRNRKFAVLGDEDLHRRVGDGFWQAVIRSMEAEFGQDRFAEGLCTGITQVGTRLAEYYPHQAGDTNELDDRISFGE